MTRADMAVSVQALTPSITFRKRAVWPATRLKYSLLSIVARRPSRDLFYCLEVGERP